MKHIKVGRDKNCDVVISDIYNEVSRTHAIIEVRNNQYYITDYSTNGTFVNGMEIQNNISTPINDGDRISLAQECVVSWYDIINLLPLQNIADSKRETEVYVESNHKLDDIINQRHEVFKKDTTIRYANWGSRLAAYLLDGFFITIMVIIVIFISFSNMSNNYSPTVKEIAFAYGAIFVICWLYYGALESGSKQATWGKQIVGIKVVDVDTNSLITFGQATGRFFSRTIIGLIPIVNLLDYLAPLWSDKKQAWHDSWSSCAVIEK